MLPPKTNKKYLKGQADHIDAWLISYADLITLLFMLFVIIVSVSVIKNDRASLSSSVEQAYGKLEDGAGIIALKTPYDKAYQNLLGIVAANHADQNIAVEKTTRGISIDIASGIFFKNDSIAISNEQIPLLKTIASTFKETILGKYTIEVEGHTDDEKQINNAYSDNWDIAALRATSIVKFFVGEGMPSERLRAVSYGGTHPLVDNIDTAGNPIPVNRVRNQRIVIRLSQS